VYSNPFSRLIGNFRTVFEHRSHSVDMVGVTGSIPVAPTTQSALVSGARFRVRDIRQVPRVSANGGLHGALSLALALTIPQTPERWLILSISYAVVAFSIIVQGLTFTPLVRSSQRS
jgi:NhaP-type Na+/H+ or K+/H+ antiporter